MTTHSQRGSALVTGLVFLVVIIMLGLSASNSSIQQELGVRNIRDQNIAMEAADAALRAGETWLSTKGALLPTELDPVDGNPVVKKWGFCDTVTPSKSCADADAGFWETNGELMWFGVDGGATSDLSLVEEQPRFIIEFLEPCATCNGYHVKYYRITARGVGMNKNTYRIVQSIYRYTT